MGAEIERHCDRCIAGRKTRRKARHFLQVGKFVGKGGCDKYPFSKSIHSAQVQWDPVTDLKQDSSRYRTLFRVSETCQCLHHDAILFFLTWITGIMMATTSFFNLTGIKDMYPWVFNLTDIRCLIWQILTKAVLWRPETSGCYVLKWVLICTRWVTVWHCIFAY